MKFRRQLTYKAEGEDTASSGESVLPLFEDVLSLWRDASQARLSEPSLSAATAEFV